MNREQEEKIAEMVIFAILCILVAGGIFFGVGRFIQHLLGEPCVAKTVEQSKVIEKQEKQLEQYAEIIKQCREKNQAPKEKE